MFRNYQADKVVFKYPSLSGPSHSNTQQHQHYLSGVRDRAAPYPRSISISDMLLLGKKVVNKEDIEFKVFAFDIGLMAWSTSKQNVRLQVADKAFAEGGFRSAYNAKCIHTSNDDLLHKGTHLVLKKYLPSTIKTIEDLNQTLEQYTKKKTFKYIVWQSF